MAALLALWLLASTVLTPLRMFPLGAGWRFSWSSSG